MNVSELVDLAWFVYSIEQEKYAKAGNLDMSRFDNNEKTAAYGPLQQRPSFTLDYGPRGLFTPELQGKIRARPNGPWPEDVKNAARRGATLQNQLHALAQFTFAVEKLYGSRDPKLVYICYNQGLRSSAAKQYVRTGRTSISKESAYAQTLYR